jgi:3-dehydroquinate dehydratase I
VNQYSKTPTHRVKAPGVRSAVVAVILSRAELKRASRLRRPPDFFELRLDSLTAEIPAGEIDPATLRAPVIVTARDPAEGGVQQLSISQRCDLLLRFLPHAAFVDVELRFAAQMEPVLTAAAAAAVQRIISLHALDKTPPIDVTQRALEHARELSADVFKLAVRTDTAEQLGRLLAFFDEAEGDTRISAMGVGKLGRASRIELARRGSALNYAHLGRAAVPGQLSLAEIRRVLGR